MTPTRRNAPVTGGPGHRHLSRFERDLAADHRAERRVAAKELAAILVVVVLAVVRQLWLS